jgi:hypothetical protein
MRHMPFYWIFDNQWNSCMWGIPSSDVPIVMKCRRRRAVSGKAAGNAQTCRNPGAPRRHDVEKARYTGGIVRALDFWKGWIDDGFASG